VTVQLTPELFQQFKEHMRAEQERTGYQISQADILRAMIVNTVKGAK
jgi:C-terminal processing protease CtpA/Prc